MKKNKITTSEIVNDFKEAMALIMEVSEMLDYEDERNPTYGPKARCEKFLRKIKKRYCK